MITDTFALFVSATAVPLGYFAFVAFVKGYERTAFFLFALFILEFFAVVACCIFGSIT